MSLLKLIYGGTLVKGIIDIIDIVRDKVEPVSGSVVYGEIFLGYAEHSGVYVGNGKIVHLTGTGNIEITGTKGFLGETGKPIYVSCDGNDAVGSNSAARRALSCVGGGRNYNFILDNCHQFSSGCLTGDFENADNFLWMLKQRASEKLNANTWRRWDV